MSTVDESDPSLAPRVVGAIGGLMATLADPNRIAILEMLRSGELNGLRMADELGIPHKNVSHHLAILVRAGVVGRRREGRLVLYAVEDWTALWLIEQAAHRARRRRMFEEALHSRGFTVDDPRESSAARTRGGSATASGLCCAVTDRRPLCQDNTPTILGS